MQACHSKLMLMLQDMLKIWLKDPMHVEKNNSVACWKVFTSQVDTFACRKDMRKRESKPWVWPMWDEDSGQTELPPASYVLSAKKFKL